MYPKAILLDLDDTIIAYDHGLDVDGCWKKACRNHFQFEDEQLAGLIGQFKQKANWYWSDPERHRAGRQDLDKARAEIISAALAEAGHDDALISLAEQVAIDYGQERDRAIVIYPGAAETIRYIRQLGIKLAMITNGSARAQRRKIDRFELAPLFDIILVEGEFGVGKPEQAVYLHALQQLNVEAGETWMVGDNFEWEIVAPQSLSMKGIWVNPKRQAPPNDVTPYRTIERLSELRGLLDELAV
ncbi:HAD family hydrolase [Paenibacillus rhizovicinus]|uniref:HAD family hydrolase n=1 Tax=Paenibacillus rhizovicinus TaxID=2704463 RepID=A0A6C0NUM5_9BACL|nr:HAD family hydrolase [Paenibacillus rhizovicinus]QHW29887.1 HAD family hydrolase [Paenibacillus rhizovicinus]